MMTETQFLLGKVAQECAEIAQRASKAQEYGLDEIQEGQPLNNLQRLRHEVVDLWVVLQLLETQAACGEFLTAPPSSEEIVAKCAKLRKYRKLSVARGMVEP